MLQVMTYLQTQIIVGKDLEKAGAEISFFLITFFYWPKPMGP